MTRTRRKVVTSADVAALADVSLGTVSKAMNNSGQLKAETRQRVLAAARELGFQPNRLAASLISGRTYTVGVIMTDAPGRREGDFTIPILGGAEDALGPGEISMLLAESRGDPIRERHYLSTFLARRVDGILVTGRASDPRPSIGRDLPVPVVYALARSEHPDDLSIIPDDAGCARLAIEHLVAIGRKNIALLTGPRGQAASELRVQGAMEALGAAGLRAAGTGARYGDWSERWGREGLAALLTSTPDLDAVFCASDQIARGTLDAIRESGRRSPQDIAVVGIDNWVVMAEASRPTLTTVDLNLREVGRIAANRLLEAIDGQDLAGGVEFVPSQLVPRGSTEMAG